MNISALLTSAGINISICVVLLSLYSILRKQPSLVRVYFGQKLAQLQSKQPDYFRFDRLVPSASWILKAWEASEEEIFDAGGLDAVVFLRTVVFSIRIFSIAAIMCIFLVLPLNYFGQEMQHKRIPAESLDVFSIANVKLKSRWLWAHCLTLYVISCCACLLLYFEYKSITKLRLVYFTGSPRKPSYFTVLVRAIPWSPEVSYSVSVKRFFTNYYASSYLSHQMVYRSGAVQKLMGDAEKMYRMLKSTPMQQHCGSSLARCGLCGVAATNSFHILPSELEDVDGRSSSSDSGLREKECAAAFIFFRTRYAAMVASQALQSPNPMIWVTDMAPEPHDIHWANLCVPYRLLWIRRVATLLASILFMISFLLPVAFVNGLLRLDKLQRTLPFLRGILRRKFMTQLVTGYLPSVIMMLFLYTVPPMMMLFSTVEGSISRSGRKRSACIKVLYFLIWNVFFANIMSGSVIDQLAQLAIDELAKISPKDILNQLSSAVPSMATFFMTYILTSGWASLSCELIQPFGLLCYFFERFILRNKDNPYATLTFPYHTEVPRVLLFMLLGFTYSILAPLLLPFLLVYFFLAFLVYRNQLLNVYITKYDSGGLYWPVVHNTAIFSLVLTQTIALGVFGLKESTVASSLTIPLIICTLLFNQYCRQRFYPLFKSNPAQVFIEMDREDEISGRMEDIHLQLHSAYSQFISTSSKPCTDILLNIGESGRGKPIKDPEDITPGKSPALQPPHLEIKEPNQEIIDLNSEAPKGEEN